MSYINEIFILDEIFSLEQQVEQEYGIPIPNISHWDSSETFQKHMMQVFTLQALSLPWDYYYTYSISIEDRQQVLRNIGIPQQKLQTTMGLLLQSSTIAIVNMINLLVHFDYKKLCILQPAYFSVESCCSMFSLEYSTEQILFTDNQPKIPVEKIIAGKYDCIWITSPIFCTGYYPNDKYLEDIGYLRSIGMTLIFDESLALPGKELIRYFPVDKNLFAIYSPHKAISINGLKFAIIICDKLYEDFLEQWVDIFSGALSASNRDAVFHYISPNYLYACYPAYKSYVNQAKTVVTKIIEQFPFASLLPNTDGHYINIFLNLNFREERKISNLLNDVIHNCMASFIPTTLNGFDSSQGFGFRINLTKNIKELEGAITRIMLYMETKYY